MRRPVDSVWNVSVLVTEFEPAVMLWPDSVALMSSRIFFIDGS